MNPLVASSGPKHGEGYGSFPVQSRKRNWNHVNSGDELEEPEKKSRRSIRQPMHPSKRPIQDDAEVLNGGQGTEEARMASAKPTERGRARRTKSNKYKTHGDEGENEKEEDRRERKISKYNQKIAEGKGPEKGSLGPKGMVRIRAGQMEFKDLNNPEWSKPDSSFTIYLSPFPVHHSPSIMLYSLEANILAALAAYHCEFRRQFLDEAAEAGNFGETYFAQPLTILILLLRKNLTEKLQTKNQSVVRPTTTRPALSLSNKAGALLGPRIGTILSTRVGRR